MFEGITSDQLPAAIEAMLFVTDEPLSAVTIAQMLELETAQATAALTELQRRLEREERGIQLYEVAGGWRLYTHPAYHELLEQYVLSWDTRKLSSAALEVLAIVAYTQPTTRAQISAIRGVTSDAPLSTLIDRGYVREAGTVDAPGNPILYATTKTFLERYGLSSVKDLPNVEDFAPDEKTAQLIRERLGAPAAARVQGEGKGSTDASTSENIGIDGIEYTDGKFKYNGADTSGGANLPSPERMVAQASASVLGVVDKIDFDQLTFNADDE